MSICELFEDLQGDGSVAVVSKERAPPGSPTFFTIPQTRIGRLNLFFR